MSEWTSAAANSGFYLSGQALNKTTIEILTYPAKLGRQHIRPYSTIMMICPSGVL
jgi:hypothetical protein